MYYEDGQSVQQEGSPNGMNFSSDLFRVPVNQHDGMLYRDGNRIQGDSAYVAQQPLMETMQYLMEQNRTFMRMLQQRDEEKSAEIADLKQRLSRAEEGHEEYRRHLINLWPRMQFSGHSSSGMPTNGRDEPLDEATLDPFNYGQTDDFSRAYYEQPQKCVERKARNVQGDKAGVISMDMSSDAVRHMFNRMATLPQQDLKHVRFSRDLDRKASAFAEIGKVLDPGVHGTDTSIGRGDGTGSLGESMVDLAARLDEMAVKDGGQAAGPGPSGSDNPAGDAASHGEPVGVGASGESRPPIDI